MSVRAKFKVNSVTKTAHGYNTVQLNPVMSGSEENKQFFAATPSGRIELNITNEAIEKFEIGADYYVDFTKAE